MRRHDDIVVTGMGSLCALGSGCDELWQGIAAGRSGLIPLRRFPTEGVGAAWSGLVPDAGTSDATVQQLALDFGRRAGLEALHDAGVQETAGVAFINGAPMTEDLLEPHLLTESIADALGVVDGPRITVSVACASSTVAIGLGSDILRAGEAELVLVGGVDVVVLPMFAGFYCLGVMGAAPCTPFSEPPGMTIGEGAGYLVLESRQRAMERGATPRASLLGRGLAGDAYHETSPHPRGEGVARALRAALSDAGLESESVGYVNAHGTGTENNDVAEWRGIRAALGEAPQLLVSSSKGHLGHTQNAAGALEAIITVLAMERGVVPPTFGFTRARRGGPADPVGDGGGRPRPHQYRFAISTSSAFAGTNAAVVLGQGGSGTARVSGSDQQRAVRLLGVGCNAGGETDPTRHLELIESGEALARGTVDFDLERLLRRADVRKLDRSAILMAGAAAMALRDASVKLRGRLRERCGLMVGITQPSAASLERFFTSLQLRGLPNTSTNAFARSVLNATQGSCAQLLSIKGPQATLSVGTGSGLIAITTAAEMLSRGRDASMILAGGVTELDLSSRGRPGCEGAACALLGAAPDDSHEDDGMIHLTGWSVTGSSAGPRGAIERALARGRCSADEVDAYFGVGSVESVGPPVFDIATTHGHLGALPSAVAFAAAVARLRRSEGKVVVVSATSKASTCSAVLLERRGRCMG